MLASLENWTHWTLKDLHEKEKYNVNLGQLQPTRRPGEIRTLNLNQSGVEIQPRPPAYQPKAKTNEESFFFKGLFICFLVNWRCTAQHRNTYSLQAPQCLFPPSSFLLTTSNEAQGERKLLLTIIEVNTYFQDFAPRCWMEKCNSPAAAWHLFLAALSDIFFLFLASRS